MVVHMTYIPYPLGTFFSHGTPVWPWPVIKEKALFGYLVENTKQHKRGKEGSP